MTIFHNTIIAVEMKIRSPGKQVKGKVSNITVPDQQTNAQLIIVVLLVKPSTTMLIGAENK